MSLSHIRVPLNDSYLLRLVNFKTDQVMRFFLVIFFSLQLSYLHAAQITKHENDSKTLTAVMFRGEIVEGDLFRLQSYLSKQSQKQNVAVYLDSPGGNLFEGIKLGEFFFDTRIKTVIEGDGGSCFSACALAFLGGRDKTGKPWRAKSSNSPLGFHSFSLSFDPDRTYTAQDLSKVTQDAQDIVLDIADYLNRIGTDLNFLRIMFRARADQMNHVRNEEAVMIGIRVWNETNKQMVNPLR